MMQQLLSLLSRVPPLVPLLVGITATALFLLSYQQRSRRRIIIVNTVSRMLYVLQYCLLGAFSGAALDVLGAVISVVAERRGRRGFVYRHRMTLLVLLDLSVIALGLLLYENLFSLLPILGVLLHTGAFWIENERIIRRISLLGSPCWLGYNLSCRAYGSALGDLLTIGSILVAMHRYRAKEKERKEAP